MIRHFHFKTLSSTQDCAFELLEAGEQAPFFVTADQCTALRGRRGRRWEFESSRSLAMSLSLVTDSQTNLSGFSLVVGLAVLEFLKPETLLLKWPNDIMKDDHKIGGILIDSRLTKKSFQVIVGVGINLFDLQDSDYKGLGHQKDSSGLAEKIYEFWSVFCENGFSYFRDDFLAKMWGRNRDLRFELSSGGLRTCRLKSVDDLGRLEIETGGLLELQSSGEILFEGLS